MGPLLFLVYINEMPFLVEQSKLLQFADDTTVICSGENDMVRKHLNSKEFKCGLRAVK